MSFFSKLFLASYRIGFFCIISLQFVYAQPHAITREVFKGGLTFSGGMFRTPAINEGFDCNLLTLKKKGLLEIEQPSGNRLKIPYCGEGGIRTLGTVSRTSV